MGILPRALLQCALSTACVLGETVPAKTFQQLHWKGDGALSLVAGEGVLMALTGLRFSFGPTTLFRSLDTGRTWRPIPLPPEETPFPHFDLRFDPASRLFHLVMFGGVYVAAPAASRWTLLLEEVTTGYSIHGNTIVHSSPTSGDTVHVSRDGGRTWKISGFATTAPQPTLMGLLAADPCAYAAFQGAPILVSCDGGTSWRRSGGDSLSHDASSLVVSPDGAVLAVAAAGILRTTDNGMTWAPWNGNLPPGIGTRLARDGSSLLAWRPEESALYRSTDGGRSWTALNLDPSDTFGPSPFSSIAEAGNRLLYSDPQGLKISADGGRTWDFASTRVIRHPILSLAARGNRFLAHTEQGIFVSMDSAITWDPAFPAGAAAWTAFSGSGPLHAAGSADGQVRLSADHGATWSRPYALPSPEPVTRLAASGSSLLAATAQGLWRLSPIDSAWSAFALPAADTFRVLGSGPNAALIAAASHLWELRPDGAFADRSAGIAPRKVMGLWNLDDRLFAYTSDGVLHQWSAAHSAWQPSGTFSRHVLSVAGAGEALAATTYMGHYLSVDGGWNWVPIDHAPASLRNLAYADGCIYGGDDKGNVWAMRIDANPTSIRPQGGGKDRIRRSRAPLDGLHDLGRRLDGRRLGR